MTTIEVNKTANEIFQHIKAEIKKLNAKAKDNPYVDTYVDFRSDSTYDAKEKKYLDYIDVNGKEFHSTKDMYDIQMVSNVVVKLLNEQKKVRGWKNLMFTIIDEYEGVGLFNRRHYKILNKIFLPANPCKEYTALQNFINKYSLASATFGGYNKPLGNFELFSARMGGKRGVLWGEEGDRRYLDNKPNKCARFLEELRKYKGSKDTMTCKRGEEDYIDEMERKHSAYYETECDGEKRMYLEVTIKTPMGKVKYNAKIY